MQASVKLQQEIPMGARQAAHHQATMALLRMLTHYRGQHSDAATCDKFGHGKSRMGVGITPLALTALSQVELSLAQVSESRLGGHLNSGNRVINMSDFHHVGTGQGLRDIMEKVFRHLKKLPAILTQEFNGVDGWKAKHLVQMLDGTTPNPQSLQWRRQLANGAKAKSQVRVVLS